MKVKLKWKICVLLVTLVAIIEGHVAPPIKSGLRSPPVSTTTAATFSSEEYDSEEEYEDDDYSYYEYDNDFEYDE
jgi:hypothetical protein